MNFNEMKLAIYESYSNGEITRDAASRLINSFENASIDHELDLALEAVDNAESSFMESAMQYSTGEVAQEVFEAEAKSFGAAVKKAWEAFKKWVKDIVSKVTKKLTDIKNKITGNDKKCYSKYPLDKIKKAVDSVIGHLKPPYNAEDKQWFAITTSLGLMVGGAGVVKAYDTSIAVGIKDSLIKLSSKLDEIENKASDGSKMIKVIRPVITICNTAIASILSRDNVGEKGMKKTLMDDISNKEKAKNEYDSSNYDESLKKVELELMDLSDKEKDASVEREAAYSELIEYLNELHKHAPESPEYEQYKTAVAGCQRDVKAATKTWTAAVVNYNKAVAKLKKLNGARSAYANASAKYVRSVMRNVGAFIRSDIGAIMKVINSAKTPEMAKKIDIKTYFDNVAEYIKIYDANVMPMIDVVQKGDVTITPCVSEETLNQIKSTMKQIGTYENKIASMKETAKNRGFDV